MLLVAIAELSQQYWALCPAKLTAEPAYSETVFVET